MISDLFTQKGQTLSFEVSPPKTEEEFAPAYEKLKQLAALSPDFISVTYGAGGSRSVNTEKIASYIHNMLKVPTLAHLTCVGSKKADILQVVKNLQDAGIDHVLALRGDRPSWMEEAQFLGRDFAHASDLIRFLNEKTTLHFAGACYPEKHYEAKSPEEDIAHLKEKADAGAEFLITQLFFDNEFFYRFLDRIRAAGITLPVCAGIMPITTAQQIGTTVHLSGSSVPKAFADMVAIHANDREEMRKAGTDYAIRQILDLQAHGVSHIHLYTMNRPKTTREIVEAIRPGGKTDGLQTRSAGGRSHCRS